MTIEFRTTLAPDNTSPRFAREFVRDSLDGQVEPGVVEDVVLLASELVTNVVRHAGTDADLWLTTVDGCVQLSCRDHSPVLPERRYPGPEDENGRGMYLIETIANAWGVERLPSDGKVVWVRVDRPDGADCAG